MRTARLLASLALVVSLPAAAQAQETSQAKFVRALDRMMVELGPQSAHASKTIRESYRDHLDLLVLDDYADLEGAIYSRGVAPLPSNPLQFNLQPRVKGAYPIGEKDLSNQVSYIAARPATIGALLDIASRVKSGPIEVTSLVRHSEYQDSLRSTNKNATTSVPMHTMGLAFDIALVNTPLDRVYEIRNVLLRMRNAGDILFIGERKQLVFHVVPHPSRLGYFTDIYTQALGAPPAASGAHIVAFSPVRDVKRGKLSPSVTAEVVAVLPAVGFGEQWWAADHAHGDLSVDVTAAMMAPAAQRAEAPVEPARGKGRFAFVLGIAFIVAGLFVTRRPQLTIVAPEAPLSSV